MPMEATMWRQYTSTPTLMVSFITSTNYESTTCTGTISFRTTVTPSTR